MFIKNYSDTDLVIKYKGGVKTLKSKDVTYIDDSWITFAMVYAMFGNYVGLVEGTTPIEDFLFDNQTLVEADRVYKVVKTGPGTPRVMIQGGTATLYFADLAPENIKDMYPSQAYTDAEGMILLSALTNYIAFKTTNKAKVVFTNFKVV